MEVNIGEKAASIILHKYYGESERKGMLSNNSIAHMINWATGRWIDDSKIAWCAIFMSYILNEVLEGQFRPIPIARRFDTVGHAVDTPQFGDLVIFWRHSPNSWQGHVGIFIRETEGDIWTLGGNQRNQVNISPYKKSRVLEYRRLIANSNDTVWLS